MKKKKKSESKFVKPDLSKDDPLNSAKSALQRVKEWEKKLRDEGKLVSVRLPGGCLLTTTKAKLEERIKEYAP